jgi:glutamate synthase (NADPH/NADH) small chain
MVEIPELPNDPVRGVRNLRPAIDYGRCCWCALCVDLCPTGSISLSREYVHTCHDDELDSYFVLPDPNGIHNQAFGYGWDKSTDSDLVDPSRQVMEEIKPGSRVDNFDEIVAGYDKQQAIIEASRCVQCGMCHDACPTHMDAPGYIRSIWKDDLEEAIRQIYETNPFSHTCGRVCTHRCEDACSIGHRGEPVAIRWLKRYAMDSVGHDRVKEIAARGRTSAHTGKKIAIIGAGPAGLTAAYDLVRSGHEVNVYEAESAAGGMTRYGIPEYRLPYDMLDQDVDVVEAMGVKIHYNTRIGEQISMSQLEQDNDAVVLAIGLWVGRSTRIPGSNDADVRRAIDLLRQITNGDAVDVPESALVVGGGNVAMDISRSLARLQMQKYGRINMTVTALEAIEQFLADPEEIREAMEEGIRIIDARGPQEVMISDHRVRGLRTWKVLSIFDEQGRFSPHYDDNDEQIHPADMIIEAIGQMSDTNLLGEELTERLEWNRGRLAVDEQGRTSEAWLWAAGDCVNGPDVVHAVADGHRVASSINEQLGIRENAA